ncbi:MAG TPA: OmpA family protein [Lutibacter sp.]|nr:OmpA family protein [Lutibacter sp.]
MRLLSFIILSLVPFLVAGQESLPKTESSVVISETQLMSIAQKMYDYKIRMQAKNEVSVTENYNPVEVKTAIVEKTYLQQLKIQDAEIKNYLKYLETKNDDRYDALYARISKMELDLLGKNAAASQSVINVPQQIQKNNPAVIYIKEPAASNKQASNLKETLILNKIDSLTAVLAAINNTKNNKIQEPANNKIDDLANNKNTKNTDSLKNEINKIKESIDKITQREETKIDFRNLYVSYEGYKNEIFFDTNSYFIEAGQLQKVQEIAAILNSNKSVDVFIKGFASNTGKAEYNLNLSMQRTESVKKALIKLGIPPLRILTDYYGIDYNAENLPQARRAAIELLIKK